MYRLLILVAALAVANVSSAGQVVYPAKGQTPEQQTQDEAAEQQQAAIAKQQAGQDAFNKARAACLEGRGYTVK